MAGGHCGYVLQPSTMRDEAFDPFDKSSLRGLEPCVICIEVGIFVWVLQGGKGLWRMVILNLLRRWGPGGSAQMGKGTEPEVSGISALCGGRELELIVILDYS